MNKTKEIEAYKQSIGDVLYNFGFCLVGSHNDDLRNQHKEQILNLVSKIESQIRKELIAEIKKRMLETEEVTPEIPDHEMYNWMCGYNKALSEVNEILDSAIEKMGEE